MGFFDKIQSRLEVYRLEQRYTRNRHRRSHFISNAMYVDGEYVFEQQNTGSSYNSTNSSSTTSTATNSKTTSAASTPAVPRPQRSISEMRSSHRESSSDARGNRSSSYFHGGQQYHDTSGAAYEESERPNMGNRSYTHQQSYGSYGDSAAPTAELPERKKLHRFSSVPAFLKTSTSKKSPPSRDEW
ncbi:hypothetical protein F5Y16DRAFT_405777 [Xylariaceae sp. FL0255]|nr:hypothetical protein F5Y16DRAFT_405777 [Xylariaceae sp. FL0255]